MQPPSTFKTLESQSSLEKAGFCFAHKSILSPRLKICEPIKQKCLNQSQKIVGTQQLTSPLAFESNKFSDLQQQYPAPQLNHINPFDQKNQKFPHPRSLRFFTDPDCKVNSSFSIDSSSKQVHQEQAVQNLKDQNRFETMQSFQMNSPSSKLSKCPCQIEKEYIPRTGIISDHERSSYSEDSSIPDELDEIDIEPAKNNSVDQSETRKQSHSSEKQAQGNDYSNAIITTSEFELQPSDNQLLLDNNDQCTQQNSNLLLQQLDNLVLDDKILQSLLSNDHNEQCGDSGLSLHLDDNLIVCLTQQADYFAELSSECLNTHADDNKLKTHVRNIRYQINQHHQHQSVFQLENLSDDFLIENSSQFINQGSDDLQILPQTSFQKKVVELVQKFGNLQQEIIVEMTEESCLPTAQNIVMTEGDATNLLLCTKNSDDQFDQQNLSYSSILETESVISKNINSSEPYCSANQSTQQSDLMNEIPANQSCYLYESNRQRQTTTLNSERSQSVNSDIIQNQYDDKKQQLLIAQEIFKEEISPCMDTEISKKVNQVRYLYQKKTSQARSPKKQNQTPFAFKYS